MEYPTRFHQQIADPKEMGHLITELKEQGLDDSTIYDLLYSFGADSELLKKKLEL
jgi:hypothetical protein